MENFAEMAREFQQGGAWKEIQHATELAMAVQAFLEDSAQRECIGARGRALVKAKRGITERIAGEIWNAYALGVVAPPHRLLKKIFLGPLSLLWRAGRAIDAARSRAVRRELQTPVISVGGLTMGGVGKSPMVAHLAKRLRQAGHNPAILTRGYRRRSPDSIVILERGHPAPSALTGDEAQIFLRGGDAHVGIGKNRYAVGARMEREFRPDVFLLDDGFQHEKLARRHDLVLIDALDPSAAAYFHWAGVASRRKPCGGRRF